MHCQSTYRVRLRRFRERAAFVVQDRNYLSARWPGDAYLFGRGFCDLLGSAS